MRHLTITAAMALMLAGCQTTTTPPEATLTPAAAAGGEVSPVQARLAGKTLVNEGATIALAQDGALVGTTSDGSILRGAWTVRDGQFCRTLTEPQRLVGTACQDVTFEGENATFTGADGAATTYTVN